MILGIIGVILSLTGFYSLRKLISLREEVHSFADKNKQFKLENSEMIQNLIVGVFFELSWINKNANHSIDVAAM